MTIKANFPAIRPSLNLDFANSKVLDPRITFSRASTATYYDGKTVAKAEENLWFPSNGGLGVGVEVTKSANAAVAPDGTTTALLIVPSTVTGNHLGGYSSFPVVEAVHIFSFYAKASGYDKVRVGDASLGRIYGTFDLTALSVTASGGASYLDSGIIDVGNGWRRCWIKYNNTGSSSYGLAVTPIPTGATVTNYGQANGTGDGTSGAYFWGFQVERRSALTELTQTTTAPITNYIPALQTASANVARFDHNPVTGESKGLLIEEQRTNLLTYSEFQNGTTDAPTRSNISTKTFNGLFQNPVNSIYFNVSGDSAYAYKSVGLQGSTTYTFSAFVRMDDGLAPIFGSFSPSASSNDFAIVMEGLALSPLTYSVTGLGNGVCRVYASYTSSASPTALNVGIVKYNSNSSRLFSVTGFQLEVGAFPTSYIPTTTAQVTRSADSASMTGTNFSSWYRADEGTLVASAAINGYSSTTVPGVASFADETYAFAYMVLGVSLTGVSCYRMANSAARPTLSISTTPGLLPHSLALTYGLTGSDVLAADAVLQTSSASVGTGVGITRMNIGRFASNPGYLNGTIKRIAYYPKRLSNTELQALTA